MKSIITSVRIEQRIYLIRGQKVILDSDLAELYGVSTSNLNLAVKRNLRRFPADFMFKLSMNEAQSLILQFATSNARGGHRKPPHVFTEQGVAMLSSVLRSERAIRVNIEIMRAFVRFQKALSSNPGLAKKISDLEKKFRNHDVHINEIFSTLRELIEPPIKPKRRIGFRHE